MRPGPAAPPSPHRHPVWSRAAAASCGAILLLACGAADAAAQRRDAAAGTRPDAAALEAARRFLCPHGGAPVRGRRGRCRGGGAALAADDRAVRGWDAGIPPSARSQAPCPEGTVAVAALARPDALRCLPR